MPQPLSSLVGRLDEIAEVKGLLATSHLLTLTGVGGCGKTRLALAVAQELVPEYADGVWLIEFAPLADPTLVLQALAKVLGVRQSAQQPLIEVVIEYLQPRCALLVFDNCEHLVLACARLAEALLRACPHVGILSTSRESLGLTGEVIYPVPLLPTPNPNDLPNSPAGYMQFAAVQLFVERAVSVQPSFVLTGQNASAVAEVCCRLEGVPLAIELAATRVRTLPLEEIVARLDDCFRLLNSGARTAAPRQQTLQATLDWSYALLTPPQKSLLARLSVFAGGWTLDAAEAVCQDPGESVLDLLARLVDKSLVNANLAEGMAARYRLLEPIRQYARDRLAAADDLTDARDRHLRFYLAWAEAAGGQLHGPEPVSWLWRLEADHDNLRAAFEWALERDAAASPGDLQYAALRLAHALPWFWRINGPVGEGRQRLATALERGKQTPDLLRGAGLVPTAWLTGAQSGFSEEAVAYARAQWALAPEANDERSRTPLQSARDHFDGLTAREREVARLIAQGKSNREIAAGLVVSERTAAVHVSNILSKLGLTSRTQVATWAIARGLARERYAREENLGIPPAQRRGNANEQ